MCPPRDLARWRAMSHTLADRRFARGETRISARRFSEHLHLGVRLAARSWPTPYVDTIGDVANRLIPGTFDVASRLEFCGLLHRRFCVICGARPRLQARRVPPTRPRSQVNNDPSRARLGQVPPNSDTPRLAGTRRVEIAVVCRILQLPGWRAFSFATMRCHVPFCAPSHPPASLGPSRTTAATAR